MTDLNMNPYYWDSPKQQFMLNALLMCKQYDKNWLSKMIDRGFIRCTQSKGDAAKKAALKESLFRLMDIYMNTYGDNVEFSLGYNSSYKFYYPFFIVRYKKFTITNSVEASHIIRDLLVVQTFIQVEAGFLSPNIIKGTRLSKTVAEVISGYRQSHLPGHDEGSFLNYPFQTGPFCLGSSDISMMISDFEYLDTMDYERYELYLYAIDATVKWESLEGVPHRRMSSIGIGTVDSVNAPDVTKVVQKILNDKIPLDFDFYVADSLYKIKPNLRASNFIARVVQMTPFVNKEIILVVFNPSLKSYSKALTKSSAKGYIKRLVFRFDSQNPPFVAFRGQKLQPRIIKDNNTLIETKPEHLTVYPKFLADVIKQLESRVFEKNVAISATKIIDSRRNAFRGLTPDQISV